MKKLFNKIGNTIAEKVSRVKTAFNTRMIALSNPKLLLANKRGENFIDSGFKVLIVVVLAALLLAGLYTLFNETIMPNITNRVKELFNYKG